MTQSARRRIFGRSHDSTASKDSRPSSSSKDGASLSSSPTVADKESKESKEVSKDKDEKEKDGKDVSVRSHARARKSVDGGKAGDRLSIFGGTFSGMGKGRKPPPRYSGYAGYPSVSFRTRNLTIDLNPVPAVMILQFRRLQRNPPLDPPSISPGSTLVHAKFPRAALGAPARPVVLRIRRRARNCFRPRKRKTSPYVILLCCASGLLLCQDRVPCWMLRRRRRSLRMQMGKAKRLMVVGIILDH